MIRDWPLCMSANEFPIKSGWYPSITICIVNYNGRKYLKGCLLSIREMNYPKDKYDVVIVDNASQDGSVNYLRQSFPEVRVLDLDKNYGFAKGNNLCAHMAKGEYLLFLNNDTVVKENFLVELVKKMASDKEIGVVGSKLLFLEKPDRVNSAGGTIIFTGGGYDIGFMATDSKEYNISSYRGCICGACLLVRKNEFFSVGMFDEDYFMYFEDTDLCWRYWLYGKKVLYVSESTVYHEFGAAAGKSKYDPLRTYYGTRNSLFNIVKNYETHNIFLPLLLFSIVNLIKFLVFLLKLNLSSVYSLVKGYHSFLINLPHLLEKRKEVQERRVIADSYLFRNNLIESPLDTFKEFIRLTRIDST